MSMLNCMVWVLWIFTLQTNSEEITLPREIYDILLTTFQTQHTASDSQGIIQRLTSIETKLQVYNEDRNQFLNYFKVTTDVLERLRKLEEENELLKKSLSETVYKMQETTNSTQETETEIQKLKKYTQNNLKETKQKIRIHMEEMTNVNRQRNIEHKNITTVFIKLSERIENIENRQLVEHNNITDVIENIRCNLENLSSIEIQHEKLIFNLTTNVNNIQQRHGVMQESLIYVEQQTNNVNKTCLEANLELNITAGRIKQNIDDLERHIGFVLNATNCTNENLKNKNPSHKYAEDCKNLFDHGETQNGIYTISPDGLNQLSVYCDMTNGGWTMIQKRVDGRVNFDRNWEEYENGFGNLSADHWLGLKHIHLLTKVHNQILFKFVLYNTGHIATALYKGFYIEGSDQNYRMHTDNSPGTYNPEILPYITRDGFNYHNGQQFSVKDDSRSHNSCSTAKKQCGGYWYKVCYYFGCFNGPFRRLKIRHGDNHNRLLNTEIKIKRQS